MINKNQLSMHRGAGFYTLLLFFGFFTTPIHIAHSKEIFRVIADQRPSCVAYLSEARALASPQDREQYIYHAWRAIESKIEKRVSRLNEPKPVLVRELPDENGTYESDLEQGMARLFVRDILVQQMTSARDRFDKLVKAWAAAMRPLVSAEHEAAKVERHERLKNQEIRHGHRDYRDADGVFYSSFLEKNKNVLLLALAEDERNNHKEKLNHKSENDIEAWLKNYLVTKYVQDIVGKAEISEMMVDSRKVLAEIVEDYNSGLTREPDFARFNRTLSAHFSHLKQRLAETYELRDGHLTSDLRALMEDDFYNHHYINKNEHGEYEIQLPQGMAVATYAPDVATMVLRHTKSVVSKYGEPAFNVVYSHGAGTNRSNVASWLILLPQAGQFGADAFAFDLPGSVGERGVSFTMARTSEELGLYLERLMVKAQSLALNQELPLVHLGRSMGSTDAYINAVEAHLLGFETRADLFFLTSFSNPQTLEMQTKALQSKLRRGDIKNIVEESLFHADGLTLDFQNKIDQALVKDPDLFSKFGDEIVFLQGELDEDGGATVVEDLEKYSQKYAPYSHRYIFVDPMQEYREAGLLDGVTPDKLESSHFLLSNFPNITESSRGHYSHDIPESDLPKLRDQSVEVYALMYAMMDYIIDLSPVTPKAKRERLFKQRANKTGSENSFSYLRWFLEDRVNPQLGSQQQLHLDEIVVNKQIRPDRSSGLAGRIKKVHQFCRDEANRILALEMGSKRQ